MDAFYWGILLAARVAPVVFLVPAFGGRRLPIPAKLGLIAMLSIVAFPHAAIQDPVPGTLRYVGLLLKELSVGTVLALAAACLFEGMKMGGQLVDHLRGASNSEVSAPHGEERTTPLGNLHLLIAVVVFFAAGGPALFLQALAKSLSQVPLNSLPAGSDLAGASQLVINLTGEAIRTGVSIALPAALALFLSDLVLGFMNRTAPQIQVFFLGMPLKAIIGIGIVMFTLDGTLEHFLLRLTT